MDRVSVFIHDRAMFGGYPSQADVAILERYGARHFVDLTTPDDKIGSRYTTNYNRIAHPIRDNTCPSRSQRKAFATLITRLADLVLNMCAGELVYIHCKGGHGRSGTVVAALVAYIYGVSGDRAINYTGLCHRQRPSMKEKWRRLGSPNTPSQKRFVRSVTLPIYICSNNDTPFRPTTGTQFLLVLAAQKAYQHIVANDHGSSRLRTYPPRYPMLCGVLSLPVHGDGDGREDMTTSALYTNLVETFREEPDMYHALCETGIQPIYDLSFQANTVGECLMHIRANIFRGVDIHRADPVDNGAPSVRA